MENNKKWLIDLLKHSKNIKINIIHQSEVNWHLDIFGEIVDMSEKEKEFSNKQLNQLATLIETIIEQKVPPIVEEIIDKKVPKMINELVPPIVETIVDQKLEPIINCPTIKKELSL